MKRRLPVLNYRCPVLVREIFPMLSPLPLLLLLLDIFVSLVGRSVFLFVGRISM